MPKGKWNRPAKKLVCENAAWDGCTHPKPFAFQKSYAKHCSRCNAAKASAEKDVGDVDLRAMVQTLLDRIVQLEETVLTERDARKTETEELRQMITQPNVRYRRGKYSMRTHPPTCGYGEWDSDWFLGNIAPAYAWFKERKKCPLYFTRALVFIAVVLFIGNDRVKLVEFGNHPKDRNDVPIYVDLNKKERVRYRVSTNGAVEQIFEHSFLPEYEEIETIFTEVSNGHYNPNRYQVVTFRRQYKYYKHWCETVMGGNRTDGAWTSRWEIVEALASFVPFPIPTDETEIQEAEEIQGPLFWETMSVENLACFNRLFRKNETYKKLLLKRLMDRNELEVYHEEGGELV